MTDVDPIALLFGGLDQLGPGSDADTRRVLGLLPRPVGPVVVDAGCGAGRQTLVLAERLGATVHAVDTFPPFLERLTERARAKGLGDAVQTHCLDMADIPTAFPAIDLLWSEGAAYSIGFPHALATWRPAIRDGGFVVVSELTWVVDEPPAEAADFFRREYPAMQSLDANLAAARAAGYAVLATHTLPRHTWVDGYYAHLEPRARRLTGHADATVREMAGEVLEEIRIFNEHHGSFTYVFLVLEAV